MKISQSLPGAVLDDKLGVPAHFGNPFAEENQLARGRAFTDLSFMEIVTVSGADRATWLHNLTTRDFTALATGASSEMMLLDPYGHIEAVAGVIDDGEKTWFLMDQGGAQPFADFLDSMRFRMRVEVETPSYGAVGVMKPAAELTEQIVAEALIVWEDPWPRTLPGGAHYGVAEEDHPGKGSYRTVIVTEKDSALIETLIAAGMIPAGIEAWEAKRITDWRPRPNTEVVERTLPHELDWLRTAVHLEKGCYRGQETVAKLVNLGKPPRRLTYLYLEGPEGELPAPGSDVLAGDKVVGQLTSVARDSEEGPVALALLKRNTAEDLQLHIGDFAAVQTPIVSRQGKSSASPAQRPGQGIRGLHRRES